MLALSPSNSLMAGARMVKVGDDHNMCANVPSGFLSLTDMWFVGGVAVRNSRPRQHFPRLECPDHGVTCTALPRVRLLMAPETRISGLFWSFSWESRFHGIVFLG